MTLHDEHNAEVACLIAHHETVTVQCGQISTEAATVDDVVQLIPRRRRIDARTAERIWPSERAHGIALLALARLTPTILRADGPDPLHVALSYALPLVLDPEWQSWAERNHTALVAGGQLVTVYSGQLVAVDPTGATRRRHARLLRRHADTTVDEHGRVGDFMTDWCDFTEQRHGTRPADALCDALHSLMVSSGCRVRDFRRGEEVIARCVVLQHDRSRTLFDLMAVWTPERARLRPGIYSAVHNLYDAQRRGQRYSMCYGQFPYKDHILGDLPRLTLDDLRERR